ncbi:hypothetical protein EUGRSUZ_I01122 [Eucalyptus grandis]|uniref:Uncharacterized protein n=2 Tax=Eucalyptus grandis TaxID=71139 RepID=A0ACC3JGS5_EUCGR|nr:hypothetical protein EUGRSUZ_I01122 [Eucalyptus grandis]
MGSESHQLHIFFFPYLAWAHMIPMIDMAKMFAMRGYKSTLIATPHDEPTFLYPSRNPRIWSACQKTDNLNKVTVEMRKQFMRAIMMLDRQVELLIEKLTPDCLISYMFFPWTTECGILRLVFHGTSAFCQGCVKLYEPHKKSLSRMQLPNFVREETEFTKFYNMVKESEKRSFGFVMDSFYELESAYTDLYRTFLGRRSRRLRTKHTGNQASIDQHERLKWLDLKQPNLVIYICFGNIVNCNEAQLHEIAVGLEASGQQFIWVVKKDPNVGGGKEEWLPDQYESRIQNKGLIIRGWAPQVLILNHEAIGGFVTHCRWNSILGVVTAGVPMVTWPVTAEQFYNEKLVTQVLKIGVDIGAKQWRERVKEAVKRVPVGEEAEEMRRRAKALAEMARGAVEEGGSSWSDLDALIQELRMHRFWSSMSY